MRTGLSATEGPGKTGHTAVVKLHVKIEPCEGEWIARWAPEGGELVVCRDRTPSSALSGLASRIHELCLQGQGQPASEETIRQAREWLRTGERGNSSLAMLLTLLTGGPVDAGKHPVDPGDFRRCLELVRQIPQAQGILATLARESAAWQGIHENWDMIHSLLQEEARETQGESAPRTRQLMREVTGELTRDA